VHGCIQKKKDWEGGGGRAHCKAKRGSSGEDREGTEYSGSGRQRCVDFKKRTEKGSGKSPDGSRGSRKLDGDCFQSRGGEEGRQAEKFRGILPGTNGETGCSSRKIGAQKRGDWGRNGGPDDRRTRREDGEGGCGDCCLGIRERQLGGRETSLLLGKAG